MAQIISTSTEPQFSGISYSVWQIALIGAGLGAGHWGLASLLHVFLPLATASDIATILVSATGVALMIYMRMAQPLITAVATGVALWGLAVWAEGLFWAEVIAWSVGLYCLAFVLFSWLARIVQPAIVIFATVIILIITRVAISL